MSQKNIFFKKLCLFLGVRFRILGRWLYHQTRNQKLGTNQTSPSQANDQDSQLPFSPHEPKRKQLLVLDMTSSSTLTFQKSSHGFSSQ